MRQEFIPCEQALELNKLGFDEKCIGWYPYDAAALSVDGVYIGERRSGSYKLLTYAPLYQQAFRWFREKYNIRIGIDYKSTEENGYYYTISWQSLANGENPPVMVWHHRNSWAGANEPLTTYEEAELACLKKLIEIVKNKDL